MFEFRLLGEVGLELSAGEGVAMWGADFARVQGDRDDLALADAQLDAAASEAWTERVAVGLLSEVRLLGDPGRHAGSPSAAIRSGKGAPFRSSS
jgi:hypothetical protein